MSKFYLPTVGPNDWQCLLADPAKQWRAGFSAKTLAHCWESANGTEGECRQWAHSRMRHQPQHLGPFLRFLLDGSG